YRPMFGAFGKALTESAVVFASAAAVAQGVGDALGLSKTLIPIEGCRAVTKKDLVLNDYCPKMEVDPETYEVRADGELLTCEPAEVLPMAQRYFLF
ncbi:MAG: urease subunit alpha, partial [Pseudomonadota bacterium]|nr:urease subunit alpha [Pseudomonadota bacterium]